MSDHSASQSEAPQETEDTPWGFIATIALSAIAFIGYLLAQLAVIPFFTPDLSNFKMTDLEVLSTNGNFVSLATIASTIALCLILVLLT